MREPREAACQCGQLRVVAAGDPVHVSMCHCLQCQRRTGSAFGLQAAFRADQVEITGRYKDFARVSDDEEQREHVFHFCPDCGSQVFHSETRLPDIVVVAVGAFPVLPLYQAGQYAKAADMGSALVEENPGQGRLTYNTACCESLAGRPDDAIEHLRQAIEIWDGCREMAKGDSDFEPIRHEPAFVELTGG